MSCCVAVLFLPSSGGQPSLYLPMIRKAWASGAMKFDADQAVNQHDLIGNNKR